jgi:branched-chain amino acid aminotransferase
VFLVKDGVLMTPSLGTVLQSISRKSLLELAPVLGLPTMEGRLKTDLLFEAEEIFFSGTPAKALPVRRIEERILEGVPGPVCRKLTSVMTEIVAGRDERFKNWMFPQHHNSFSFLKCSRFPSSNKAF